jgi:hypothetical protein
MLCANGVADEHGCMNPWCGLVPLLMSAVLCWAPSVGAAKDAVGKPGQMELWSTEAGEQLAFDGVFYSYRSADGLSAFKLWTPPGKGPVRALLLFGNPGGGFGGDTRDKSRQ